MTTIKNLYKYVYPTPFEDSDYYLAKIISVIKGDYLQNQSYFFALTPQKKLNFEFIPELIIGFISKFFLSNISIAVIIVTFILIFVQNYAILNITKSKGIVSCIELSTFTYFIVSHYPSYYYRLISPIFGLTILIYFLSATNLNKFGIKNFIIIFLSLLSNFFTASIIILILIRRKLGNRNFLLILGLLEISILLLNFIKHSFGDDLWRWGLVRGFAPGSFRENLFGILVVIMYTTLYKFHKASYYRYSVLIEALVLALILSNSQIFTGIYVEFSSHFGPVIIYLSLLLISIFLGNLISFIRIRHKLTFNFFSFFFVSFTILMSILNIIEVTNMYNAAKFEDHKALLVLNRIPDNCQVISVPVKFSDSIPKFSKCKILYGKSATAWFSMTNMEVLERYYVNTYLQNFSNTFEKPLTKMNSEEIYQDVFERRYHNLFGRTNAARIVGLNFLILDRAKTDIAYVDNLNLKFFKNLKKVGIRYYIWKYNINYIFDGQIIKKL